MCKDCGLSKARMSALAREAGMRRARTGRAPAEDQAATRKLVEQGVIGAKPQEPPPPTERAKGAFQGEGTGSAREGSPGVPPAMRSRGARNRVASSEV